VQLIHRSKIKEKAAGN